MSMHNFIFKYRNLFLDCVIDYEPSEKGSRYDAIADVLSVSLKGVDVTEIIREDILDEISDAFLNNQDFGVLHDD
jgi:hypothetical protein